MTDPIQYRLEDHVAVITMDDGKANALNPTSLQGLMNALDRAETEAKAVVITGRPGRFSAGFDLKIMTSGIANAQKLLLEGAEVFLRIYNFPHPVVMACNGHALAGGCLTLMCGDLRIGAEGDFKLGMNEVAIGMPIPILGLELVRARVQSARLDEATLFAGIFNPAQALEAGFLTELVAAEALASTALARAQQLSALSGPAYAQTKDRLRRPTIQYIRETLESDIASFGSPPR